LAFGGDSELFNCGHSMFCFILSLSRPAKTIPPKLIDAM